MMEFSEFLDEIGKTGNPLINYHITLDKIWLYKKNTKLKLLLNEEMMSLATEVASGRFYD